MNVTIVPSSVDGRPGAPGQFATSFLINGVVALDAGSIGLTADVEAQGRIAAVVLSHSHLDHVGTLPMLLDNVYRLADAPPRVYAGRDTLDVLAGRIFTRETWMSLALMTEIDPPFVAFETIRPMEPFEVEGLTITPIPVDHAIPTFGFLVEAPGTSVLFTSDTGPTELIWDVANRTETLRAVFAEASFPDAMRPIAELSGHLTPAMLGRELRKLRRPVPVIAVHLKPRHAEAVAAELMELDRVDLHIGESGRTYTF